MRGSARSALSAAGGGGGALKPGAPGRLGGASPTGRSSAGCRRRGGSPKWMCRITLTRAPGARVSDDAASPAAGKFACAVRDDAF